LTANIRSHSCSGTWSNVLCRQMPTLLTRMSIGPSWARICSTERCTWVFTEASAPTAPAVRGRGAPAAGAAEVPAVVGTLWPVRGHGRLLLMARFYELMLGAGLLPAAALREAQCWLRDLTYAALLAYLKTAPGLPGTAAATRETSGALWAELSDVVRQSVQAGKGAERPYATPQHWAGFVCYGALSY